MTRASRWAIPVALWAVLLLGACSKDDKPAASGASESSIKDDGQIFGEVASFDLVAGSPQRVLVGISNAGGQVLAGGTVDIEFRYAGTAQEANTETAQANPPLSAKGTFLPVVGSANVVATQPRLGSPSDGVGVYAAGGVTFDKAGFWLVSVTANIDGKPKTAEMAAEVKERSSVPAVGDAAPRTTNPIIGDAGVPPQHLDSRAGPDGTGDEIADAVLHKVRIADAVAAGRPIVVVVSTPVYCVSKFCGPITDTVQQLAEGAYAAKPIDFVHLEVWEDFEAQKISPSAAEWILPADPAAGGREPWLFIVAKDGSIAARFDNVVGGAELTAAIDAALAST